ncbi:MAG: RNA polymerase sigma factor [Oscillospiraceae bacterium]
MRSFEELCKENYNRIFKYIFALTGSQESTEDLIQDVFTVAFEKGDAFLQHENPPAFLYKTARNLSLNYIKRHRFSVLEYLDDTIADGESDLCDKLLKERDMQIDETAYAGLVISSLDAKQRMLYSMRYIEHKPISEIASEQGVNEPAMRMRLVRLRREIHRIVKDLKLDEK